MNADTTFDFAKLEVFKQYADGIINKHRTTVDKLDENRKARFARADIESMRNDKVIGANHTYIGIRLIDSNIAAELPPHVMYLKQSKRIAVFVPTDARLVRDLSFKVDYVESEFSRVMMYPGWESPYLQMLDASSLHGFNHLEVMHDLSKPGHCAVNYVSNNDLLWNRDVDSIQSSGVVMRAYRVTLVDFNRLAALHAFDEKQSDELRKRIVSEQKTGADTTKARGTERCTVYRVFFKDADGFVQEAWYEPKCDAWLKDPSPFFNGIKSATQVIDNGAEQGASMDVQVRTDYKDEPQTQYPYFLKLFRLTEDGCIVNAEGRAEIDYSKQDAASATLSAFINACQDASNTMWSPSNNDPGRGGSEPKTITMELKNGAIWDQPMTPFRAPFPDSMMLTAVQTIQTLNQVETSNIAFAVNNRKDSRKTATENQLAQQQSTALSGVQVLMFSLTLTEVLNYAWRIVQSAALSGEIMFAPDLDGSNYTPVLEQAYQLRPAGDVDFVERNERVQKMQQDWPVFQATPLRDSFLQDYIKLRYPETAERYIATLQQANIMPQLLQNSMRLLEQAVTDESGKQLRPEWAPYRNELVQLAQQAQQVLAQQAQQSGQQQPQQEQEGAQQ